MADIEFPNFANVFAQSAMAGRQMAQQRQRQSALAMYATDPIGAENALMAAGDLESANALTQRRHAKQKLEMEQAGLQRRAAVGQKAAAGDLTGARAQALQAGDLDLAAEIGKLDDQARAKLEQTNAKIGGVAYQLLQVKDPGERQALAAKAIPLLVQQGALTEEMAGKVDLSDQGLQGYVGQAMQLKDVIAQANADRDFDLKKTDQETDNNRDDQRLGLERQRVGMDGARLGLERQRVGLEAQRVGIARQEAGASGKAPSGYRFNPDGSLAYIKGGPADPDTKAQTLKVVPAKVASGLAENRTALGKIDRALALVEQYPQGLGLANKLGDTVRQRTDPKGVNVRAAIADIGSQKLHDRSGANVTVSEAPRLVPFIPKVDDNAATAKKKLRMLRYEYESMINETEQLYAEDNGYRPVSGGGGAKAGGKADPLGLR